MKLFVCTVYLAGIGVLSHVVGEALPRGRFCADSFPFCSAVWEQQGAIYEHLKIRRWKHLVPDMSRILSDMLPKRLPGRITLDNLCQLIQETCVAETVHWALIAAGFICLFLWRGLGGILVSVLWAIGNLPYILIQRYNRPRLKKLAAHLCAEKALTLCPAEG